MQDLPFRCGSSLVMVLRFCCPAAYGILVSRPGIKLVSPALQSNFLTAGPWGHPSPVLEKGVMRTDLALGGAMLDSLAGVSRGLQSPGLEPPPEDAPCFPTSSFPLLPKQLPPVGKWMSKASVGKKVRNTSLVGLTFLLIPSPHGNPGLPPGTPHSAPS